MRSMFSKQTPVDECEGKRKLSPESGNIMLLFTLLLPTLLIPLAGLAIDGSIARLAQIRLQAAVDGAVLGAGRELGTAAIPETLAAEFLAANFRTDNSAGTWGAHGLNSVIVYTPGITKKIDVTATALVPLLFMRIFGKSDATIAATGSATRSDSRVVWVIDRSGSMNTSDGSGSLVITDAINYTTSLVNRFLEGSDELGLVVFDGSAVVGYPTGPWSPTISKMGTGGPNKIFLDGTGNDLPHQLAAIHANSGTGMAEAISIAYIELQKAHMRDLQADGVDPRLNSIVLLTDGVPSAVSIYFNNPANSNAENVMNNNAGAGKTCVNRTITTETTDTMMQGWIAVGGNPPYSGTTPAGVYLMATKDAANRTSNWWMSFGGAAIAADVAAPNPDTPFTGCPNMTNSGGNPYNYLSRIPIVDLYGNLLNTGGYVNSQVIGGAGKPVYIKGSPLNLTQVSQNYQWGLAMWNAADNAAMNARNDVNLVNRAGDTTGDMNIQFYVIGYSGTTGCDQGLLKRIANDKTAVGYDSTQPTGQYYSAANGAELADAYNKLASDLLRLSR